MENHYGYSKRFPKKLNLFEISRPVEFKNPSDFDPVAKKVTDQWGRWIKKYDPELQLYDLRHSWARRSIIEGVPSGLASKCLGHSITVFEKLIYQPLEKDVVDYQIEINPLCWYKSITFLPST